MINKNTFLPLIQYRNRKSNKIKTTNEYLMRDLSSSTLKKYDHSFDQKNLYFNKLIERKDKKALGFVKKHIYSFQTKKKQLYKAKYTERSQRYQQEYEQIYKKSKQKQKIMTQRQRQKCKMFRIQTLIKSLTDSPRQKKHEQSIQSGKKISTQMTSDQMKKMKSFLFSKQKRKQVVKNKQELIDKYGVLKNRLSKGLQNDIKVLKYESQKKNKNNFVSLSQKKINNKSNKRLLINEQQLISKFGQYDQKDKDSVMRTLQKTKYKYLQSPSKSKIKYIKPSKIMFQKLSKKILKNRLDTIQPWEDDKIDLIS